MLAYSEIALLSGLCLVLLVGLLAGCLFRRKKKEEKKKPLKRMKPENPRPIKLAERPTPPGQTCPVIDIKWVLLSKSPVLAWVRTRDLLRVKQT
ncbi:Chaperone SurA [Trichinella spiralis]|uniref:Chaperone SurA n=1 Tax=Trichinella spiralis TaxID=6334 RepID=A0ABR3KP56_TRISP